MTMFEGRDPRRPESEDPSPVEEGADEGVVAHGQHRPRDIQEEDEAVDLLPEDEEDDSDDSEEH
jgi:hypothetical protein